MHLINTIVWAWFIEQFDCFHLDLISCNFAQQLSYIQGLLGVHENLSSGQEFAIFNPFDYA